MSDNRSRRFNFRPYRQPPQMTASDAEGIWEILGKAIDEIYNRNASKLSFEELYRYAYNLVLHKHGAILYDGITEKLTEHLTIVQVELAVHTHESSLLEKLAFHWQEHRVTMSMIRDILMYMDRTYVPLQKQRRNVYDLGIHLFRVTVWEAIKESVCNLVLAAIARERNGRLTDDRDLLKEIVSMLLEIGQADYAAAVYQQDFEDAFLSTTKDFYTAESLTYLSQSTAGEYVQKATERIDEEKLRTSALQLPMSTTGPLLQIVKTEWIERHSKTLVDMEGTGFRALLADTSKLEEMRSMYDLFTQVPQSVDVLRDALADSIKSAGQALMKDPQLDPSLFCKGILALRERYANIVEVSFRGEKKTAKRMKESLENVLNEDARAASCLAIYIDGLLQTGLKGASDSQIDVELQKVIIIFRYLSDKDVFESYYKQHLAKRLLSSRPLNDDAERSMVSLLKHEIGYQFTTKLEGMFNDMRISRETRKKYNDYSGRVALDLEVDVLTAGHWPSQSVHPCTLPPTIQAAIDNYTEFYLKEHTGRKLSWQTMAGSAEILATFAGGRRHDLVVSTYQMCILMLFNDDTTLTLGQIRSKTHIPDNELRRHLISLTTPKQRILLKGKPEEKTISSDDEAFTFNEKYKNKAKRIRVHLVKEGSLASSAATTKVPVVVEEDRRHLVEAAIVRIMKARKSLSHNDLIAEVTRQLNNRFSPSPVFIKKRIESLIEREYVERSPNEHRVYLYVA